MSAVSTEHETLYRSRAAYYDLIYHWKDYGKEAERVRVLLHAEGIADGSRVFEAACGTGTYMQHLRKWYDMAGFDLCDEMLEIARDRLADGARLFQADMADFSVEQPFDALLCLFSSIGYVYPESRLRAAARRFADAVRPGGVVLVEPWITPEEFRPGAGGMLTYDSPEIRLCRVSESRRDGEMSVMNFHWLVAASGAATVEHFVDQHRLWLCPRELMQRVFDDAGFECWLEPDGLMPQRGLLVARKR